MNRLKVIKLVFVPQQLDFGLASDDDITTPHFEFETAI